MLFLCLMPLSFRFIIISIVVVVLLLLLLFVEEMQKLAKSEKS